MKNNQINILLLFILTLLKFVSTEKRIVCYYGSWATYRPGNGQIKVNDINPYLCTHIIYSFIGLNDDGEVKILDTFNDLTNGGFKNFIGLKKQNSRVKLMIAMGGWSEGSEKYSKVMKSTGLRKKLVSSIIQFTTKWGFDGFDFDWEYPTQRGGSLEDRQNFIKFFKELRESSKKNFIISAAVGAADYLVDTAYDVKNMIKYLDFINLMTYDYHGSWDTVTGHNAPFYLLEHTVMNWLRNGASYNKLVIGIPIYGRTWTLSNSYSHGIQANTLGTGIAGPYTLEKGMLTYLEICESFNYPGWTKLWDEIESVPYAYKDNQWLSYENLKSAKLKAQYVMLLELGGVMVWSIDGDDVFGVCGEGTFPVLNALNHVIKSY